MLSKNKFSSKKISSNIDLDIVNINKKYNNKIVLNNINLKINSGEFVAIVGQNNCGKETLLRIIAGLENYDGDLFLDSHYFKEKSRAVKVMFQDSRLLPWKNIFDNVLLGLPISKIYVVKSLLERLGLAEYSHELPNNLSIEQKQRVALARALAHRPQLLLLEKPFEDLEALARLNMQQLIESLWQQYKFTAILITDDIQEAIALADRVILIKEGSVVMDYPVNLERPRNHDSKAFAQAQSIILNRMFDSEQQIYQRV